MIPSIWTTRGSWTLPYYLLGAGIAAMVGWISNRFGWPYAFAVLPVVYYCYQRTYSYCASNDPRVHFGLGANTKIERLTVAWLGGEEEVFGPFTAGQSYSIRQGEGSVEASAKIPGAY